MVTLRYGVRCTSPEHQGERDLEPDRHFASAEEAQAFADALTQNAADDPVMGLLAQLAGLPLCTYEVWELPVGT